MKIALVSPYDFSLPGGANNHIAHLADNFRHLGHDVRVIAPCSQGQRPPRDDLIVIGEHPVSVPAGGSVARLTMSLHLAPTVKRVLAEEAFDVVHLHEPFMPFLPVQFLRFSKAVNIATFHATKDGGNRFYAYGAPLLRRWLPNLDGRIAVSLAALGMVSRYFPGDYTVIPNGINLAHFAADLPPLPDYCDDKLNILFVGRAEKRKGLKYLLRAYQRVKGELPKTRLIVVGPDGRKRGRYEEYVSRAGLQDVVFAGRLTYDMLPRYYRTADVFCAPNTSNESFGIVLLEAMAAGRPVVASNLEGFASVVTHGVSGLLVRPRDSDALALALVHLLTDDERRRQMGRYGHQKAAEYSWECIAQQVLALYERASHEKQAAAAPGAALA